MSFQDTIQTLHDLHGELCAALRRGEMPWYGMADDYQGKYAFSADYDPAFKRRYLEQAAACLELAEWLEALPLPTAFEDVARFADALKDAVARCPRPPEIRGQLYLTRLHTELFQRAENAG
jgi:hypothetical protein